MVRVWKANWPMLRVLGVERIVLELDLVIDLAVDEVREQAVVEELLPARRDQPALPVEVDVVARSWC